MHIFGACAQGVNNSTHSMCVCLCVKSVLTSFQVIGVPVNVRLDFQLAEFYANLLIERYCSSHAHFIVPDP